MLSKDRNWYVHRCNFPADKSDGCRCPCRKGSGASDCGRKQDVLEVRAKVCRDFPLLSLLLWQKELCRGQNGPAVLRSKDHGYDLERAKALVEIHPTHSMCDVMLTVPETAMVLVAVGINAKWHYISPPYNPT